MTRPAHVVLVVPLLWAVGCGQEHADPHQPSAREFRSDARGQIIATPSTGEQQRWAFHTDISDTWLGHSTAAGKANESFNWNGKWRYDSGRLITYKHGLRYEYGQQDYFDEQQAKRR